MILPLHILIALTSLLVAIITFFFPTRAKLLVSYILTALTVISGTLLIVLLNVSILRTCTTGLVYLAVISLATVMARRKLAVAQYK